MISAIPSARKLAGNRTLPTLLAGALLLAGCARDPLDEAAWQASRLGTAVGDHREITHVTGIEAGSRIVEQYYFVKKYEATQEQRRVAAAAGQKAEARIKAGQTRPKPPGSSRIAPLPPRPMRYLAVRTRSDARAKTQTSVMIWDTQAQEIVGNNVYDINSPPPVGAAVKFETFSAEYVGAGL